MATNGGYADNTPQSKISEYKPLKLYHVDHKTFDHPTEYSKDETMNGRETIVNYQSDNETESIRQASSRESNGKRSQTRFEAQKINGDVINDVIK